MLRALSDLDIHVGLDAAKRESVDLYELLGELWLGDLEHLVDNVGTQQYRFCGQQTKEKQTFRKIIRSFLSEATGQSL